MLLILMRHGIAEDGMPDEARRLTPKGKARVALMASMLEKLDVLPDLVLTSPRARARETAEVVRRELGLKPEAVVMDALDFHHGWSSFAAALSEATARLDPSATVLACGHQPQFGRLATAALLGEEREMDVKKASLMGIRFEAGPALGAGSLRFYLTPAMAKAAKP